MGHGYMREYDEDRSDKRNRWQDDDREGSRRGSDRNERNRGFMLGERGGRGNFGSGQDDHYRSWRDKQMEALDRDYADYCREREQQFHQDFDSWRNQRHGNQQPLQTGMTQTSQTGDPTGELELTNEMADPRADQPDPMADATLGTTSGRNRR